MNFIIILRSIKIYIDYLSHLFLYFKRLSSSSSINKIAIFYWCIIALVYLNFIINKKSFNLKLFND